MHIWQLRGVANLVNLATPLGLLVARAGRATVHRGPRDLRVATGYRLGFPVARAFTVGSVVISRHSADWLEARPDLMRHEESHA
ncbi:MAG: hypothetical protein ACRDP4_13180, partial [Nocardioidaceae bacterium]